MLRLASTYNMLPSCRCEGYDWNNENVVLKSFKYVNKICKLYTWSFQICLEGGGEVLGEFEEYLESQLLEE